ncbi:MAG: competence/damage-inducible protein A, partial [Actinomycetota bacterium]|nr:competence/damage-inducible protein A [Actinomycetota bacterium]
MADGPRRVGWRAQVIAVGSELLSGDSVDTNSAWISMRLAEIGVDVLRHTSVGDDVDRIADAVAEACARVDAVVVTGGLGPTQDDLTRPAVARMAGVGLERRQDLARHVSEYFARRGRLMPERNLVQADLPAGARPLQPAGTAAGFVLDVGAAVVYCLPGVPSEMRAMVE